MSIKLTKTLRERILTSVLSHKFGKTDAELRARKEALGVALYDMRYTKKQQLQMSELPAGWLEERASMRVRMPGSYQASYNFHEGEFGTGSSKLFPYADKCWEPAVGSAAYVRITDYDNYADDYDTSKNDVARTARALLDSVTTINKAIKVWPAAETLIKCAVGIHGELQKSNAPLPVIMVEKLNADLDLPPKTGAADARSL